MKRYIAAITGLPKADEQLFLGFIKKNGWGWWHRIDNFWLIIDKKDTSSSEQIRDFLMPLKGPVGFVMEIPAEAFGWAAFGPGESADELFSWVETNWSPD
jgi:hypothetical protein